MQRFHRRRVLIAGTALALISTSALAQTRPSRAQASDEGVALNEVVVTARAREERLIDVPVAATVFGTQSLERYSTSDLGELSAQIPQVSFQKAGSGSGAVLSVRGLSGYSGDSGVEQTVSTAVDGVQTSRGRIIYSALFDLQSVEILKGPQALFFGKNSPAGVLSLTSANPAASFGGYVKGGYNFQVKGKELEGAVSVPVNDVLGIRLAARYEKMDEGYTPNVAQNIADPFDGGVLRRGHSWLPGEESLAARLTVAYRPTDAFDATLKWLSAQYKSNSPGNGSSAVYACPAGQTNLTTYNVPDPFMTCTRGRRAAAISILPPQVAANYPLAFSGEPYEFLANDMVSLRMNYKLGDVTLTSITGYYTSLNKYLGNFNGTVWGQLWGGSRERNTTWTQEVRGTTNYEGPLNFVVGAFYQSDDRFFRQDTKLIPLGPDPVTGRWDTVDSHDYAKGWAYSGFGEVQYKLLENLELAAGVRYTEEKKKTDNRVTFVHTFVKNVFYNENRPPIAGSIKHDNVSPEVTLTWKPEPNVTLYAAYKTGFLSGGFSTPTLIPRTATFENQQFQPETVKGGEVGAKATLFDGRLSGDLTIYRYDFTNLQLATYDTVTISYTIQNAGEARTQGVEAQGTFLLTPDLTLRGALGYNDAYYVRYEGATCFAGQTLAQGCTPRGQSLTGQPFAGSSKWNLNFGASYDREISGSLKFGASADVFFRSKYKLSDIHPFYQDGYTRVNAMLRVYDTKQNWELALIGRNLTDVEEFTGIGDKPGGHPGEITGGLTLPREILLQAQYRF